MTVQLCLNCHQSVNNGGNLVNSFKNSISLIIEGNKLYTQVNNHMMVLVINI